MANLDDFNLWMKSTKVNVPFSSEVTSVPGSGDIIIATGMPGRLQTTPNYTPQSAPTRNAVRITQHIQTSRQSLFANQSSIPSGHEVALCSPPPNWSVKSFSKACIAAPSPIKIDAPPPFGEPPVLLEVKEADCDIIRPADTIGVDQDCSPTQKPTLSLRSRKGLPWSPPSKDKSAAQSLGLLGDSIWRVGEKDFELSNVTGIQPPIQSEIEHIRVDIEKMIADGDVAVAWDGTSVQGKYDSSQMNDRLNNVNQREIPPQSSPVTTFSSLRCQPIKNTNSIWTKTPDSLRNIHQLQLQHQQQPTNRPISLVYPQELLTPSSAPPQFRDRDPKYMSTNTRTQSNYNSQEQTRNEISLSSPIPTSASSLPKRPPAPIGPFDIPTPITSNTTTRRSSADQRSATSSVTPLPFSFKDPTVIPPTPNRSLITDPANQRPISAPLFSIPQQYDMSKKVVEAPNIIWADSEVQKNDRAPVAYVAVPVYTLGPNAVSQIPSSSSVNSLGSENDKPKERRFPICEGGRCPHKAFWSRLRAKRGYSYFVCHQCGLEWRTPSRAEKERQLRKLQEIESACDGEDEN